MYAYPSTKWPRATQSHEHYFSKWWRKRTERTTLLSKKNSVSRMRHFFKVAFAEWALYSFAWAWRDMEASRDRSSVSCWAPRVCAITMSSHQTLPASWWAQWWVRTGRRRQHFVRKRCKRSKVLAQASIPFAPSTLRLSDCLQSMFFVYSQHLIPRPPDYGQNIGATTMIRLALSASSWGASNDIPLWSQTWANIGTGSARLNARCA